MKIAKIAALTLVSTVFAAPAFAGGTGVTNSTTIRNSHGNGQVTTNFSSHKTGVQINQSQSLKSETFGGDTNISSVNFSNGQLTGSAYSANNVPIDPVAIISTTSQFETIKFTENLQQNAIENYRFNEVTNTHSVSSQSF